MQVNIYKDREALSMQVALDILAIVKTNPTAVLCLATGDTPLLAYQILAEKAAAEAVDFSQCGFIALDEWVGISPEVSGSCRHFIQSKLFDPLQIPEERVHLFDGQSADLGAECNKANLAIQNIGGIDLMLVGVGVNGHIGFNEPGTAIGLSAHVTDLEPITRSIGQKYFSGETILEKGITLGMKQVLESKRLIVMASGNKKATVMQQALEGGITPQLTVSSTRLHSNAVAMLDAEAASQLNVQQPAEDISFYQSGENE